MKSKRKSFLLQKRQMGDIPFRLRTMIAFQAMQVPRSAGGLLQTPSSEEFGVFREVAVSVSGTKNKQVK
jgi:hypothetical protein